MGGATAVWVKLILNEDLFIKHTGPEWIGLLGLWQTREFLDFISAHWKIRRFSGKSAKPKRYRKGIDRAPAVMNFSWAGVRGWMAPARVGVWLAGKLHPHGGCWHRNTLAHFQRESWADKGFSDSPGLSSFDLCCCCFRQPFHLEPSLVNERGKLCRFISVFNLRRCLRDVFLLRFLNGESSHNVWAMTAKDSSRELATPESEIYIRTFKEQMHLELELPKLSGNRPTSPKISPRSSPRNSPCFFRKLLVNKSIRQRRRFTVAHTW